ncbi:translocation and assembly module lipoprotein TamL [Mangrovimonas xylaniphaga]|uniref:translocation and assembly module lipoprotein TamL n=1 Tax=Mangrovimonas xylaniphaga TaxID=1645915 RepID=UPI0006B62BB4|nr:BamA/TamA family outer membrane protein [Mangrovimonas xylaniphaga]
MKQTFKYILVFLSFAYLLASCNVMKRVGEDQFLLSGNTTMVNGKKVNTEAINNSYYQKPNGKLLGYPLRLHIYNLARPNLDSILKDKIYNDPKKLAWKTRLLSRKQLDKDVQSRLDFNAWLKKTGEAPVIVDLPKTEKTTTNLSRYFISNGWFDVQTSYSISKTDNRRASVTYFVETGKPYILDSISEKIASPIVDSLYQNLKKESLIKSGEQYKETNFTNERERLTSALRNSGLFHFGQDYITFDIDTIGSSKKVFTDLIIKNRSIRYEDSIARVPFKIYKIKQVNIYTDHTYTNKETETLDSIEYKGYKLYSYGKLRYRPKALTDAVFISKDELFRDLDRSRTYRYLTDLKVFRYPNIEYIENPQDTTLTANIYLSPKKKYDLGYEINVTQSNIQTIGFSLSGGLIIRNVFRGAETLEMSALGSIGSSKDASISQDQFFDINEAGGNIKLTIPRIFFPIRTNKIIPKYMSPSTRISVGATTQRNIGLDKQTLNGTLNYNWTPSKRTTNSLDFFNLQFVKNLNPDNYFGVYQNSYNTLNDISNSIDYNNGEDLTYPGQTDQFINDVLTGNTSITPSDDDFETVSAISERQNRLTENNLILASSFNYVLNKRENLLDNDFSIFRFKFEVAGPLLNTFSRWTGSKKNANDQYEILGVAFSQYMKGELDYVKYWDLGKKNIVAVRSYLGMAIPYGNSNSIPFSKSFFSGGPNDIRAWTAYNLGPGSSQSINEFNEANMKITLSLEERFNVLGNLNGALFVDAGNIWNIADNVNDDRATFSGVDSLKDIAVGSGFGLRYDFTFFVLRGDIGFKTYDPSYDLGERWFKDYNFGNAVYNIGINYPF